MHKALNIDENKNYFIKYKQNATASKSKIFS
jgi:hypothetical protein